MECFFCLFLYSVVKYEEITNNSSNKKVHSTRNIPIGIVSSFTYFNHFNLISTANIRLLRLVCGCLCVVSLSFSFYLNSFIYILIIDLNRFSVLAAAVTFIVFRLNVLGERERGGRV